MNFPLSHSFHLKSRPPGQAKETMSTIYTIKMMWIDYIHQYNNKKSSNNPGFNLRIYTVLIRTTAVLTHYKFCMKVHKISGKVSPSTVGCCHQDLFLATIRRRASPYLLFGKGPLVTFWQKDSQCPPISSPGAEMGVIRGPASWILEWIGSSLLPYSKLLWSWDRHSLLRTIPGGTPGLREIALLMPIPVANLVKIANVHGNPTDVGMSWGPLDFGAVAQLYKKTWYTC